MAQRAELTRCRDAFYIGALTRRVHQHLSLRVAVDGQTHLIPVEVECGVEMPQEESAHEENVVAVRRFLARLVYDEETGVFASYEKVLFRRYLEHVITQLKGDGLHFFDHFLARFLHVTEGMIFLAH